MRFIGTYRLVACTLAFTLAASFVPWPGAQALASTASFEQYQADLYVPQTALVNPPTAVWEATAGDAQQAIETLAPADSSDRRPQVGLVPIGADTATADAVEVRLQQDAPASTMPLRQFVEETQATSIPALCIHPGDTTTAEALAEFCPAHDLEDAYVVSDAETVAAVTARTEHILGVIDCRSTASASTSQLQQIAYEANTVGARIILLDASAVTADQVQYLRDRFTAVWLVPASASIVDLRAAIQTGADGILTTEYGALYDALSTYKTANSIGALATVAGHRGTGKSKLSGYAENTIGAYRWAVAQGARAIETDIWLLNGKLVVSHDQPASSSGLTTLDAVLAEFQNTPTVVYVELKGLAESVTTEDEQLSYATHMVAALKSQLARRPAAKDNVVFITFRSTLLAAIAQDDGLPWAPRAYLSSFATNTAAKIRSSYQKLAAWGCAYNPSFSSYSSAANLDYVRGLRARGLMLGYWTVNGADLDKAFLRESASITTDTANRSAGYACKVVAANCVAAVPRDAATGRLKTLCMPYYATAYAQDGRTIANAALSFVPLDGNLVWSGGSWLMKGNRATVCIACRQTMANGSAYTIYSDAFQIAATDVTDAANRVTVQWNTHKGKKLASESYYVAAATTNAPALTPIPTYKKTSLPKRGSTKTKHYLFNGWKSSFTGKGYSSALPALTIANAGKKLTLTARYRAQAHKKGPKASCKHAQKCTVCNHVLKKALGHSRKAGICTRCGAVVPSSKVKDIRVSKAGKKHLEVGWSKKTEAQGYRVKYRIAGTTAWTYKTVPAKKAKTSFKRKGKCHYEVRVQLYVKVKGKRVYGKWSALKRY